MDGRHTPDHMELLSGSGLSGCRYRLLKGSRFGLELSCGSFKVTFLSQVTFFGTLGSDFFLKTFVFLSSEAGAALELAASLDLVSFDPFSEESCAFMAVLQALTKVLLAVFLSDVTVELCSWGFAAASFALTVLA